MAMKNKEDIYPIFRSTGVRFMRGKKQTHERAKGFLLEQQSEVDDIGDFVSNGP